MNAGLKAGREGADTQRVGVSTVITRAASILGIALALAGCSSPTPSSSPVSLPTSTAATVTVGPAERGTGPTVTVTTPPVPSKPDTPARVPTPVVSMPTPPAAHAATTAAPSTLVGHILRTTTAYSAATGGRVVGTLSPTTRSAPTWVPVTARVPGYVQIRFLSGRITLTGWVHANAVDVVDTLSWVEVHRAAHTLTVHDAGKPDQTFPVLALGDAKSRWPTPLGTYWLARFADDPNPIYGNSTVTETSARGTWSGASVIAVHAWTAKISQGASSHGCIRVPATAAKVVADLPYATPIRVSP